MIQARMEDGSTLLFNSVNEVAERFHVHPSLVRKWLREGFVSGAGQSQGLRQLTHV